METIVIWDWNGTLLNDVGTNHTILNAMLDKRGMRRLSLDEYRRAFRLPIIKLYEAAGFTFESETFEQVAQEYIVMYRNAFEQIPLSDGVFEVLEAIRGRNIRQYIVSAMNETDLLQQVRRKNIDGYFDAVAGIDSIHATGKKQRAVDFVNSLTDRPAIVLIGDMDHDYEVAQEIGARCILYSKGHQTPAGQTDCPVIDDLRDAVALL